MEYFNNSNCDFDPATRALANEIVAGILTDLGDPTGANPNNVNNACDNARDQMNGITWTSKLKTW